MKTVLAMLMMLAFLIDQVEQMCCRLFQVAWEKMGSKVRLWGRIRATFELLEIDSWESLYKGIHGGIAFCRPTPVLDTG